MLRYVLAVALSVTSVAADAAIVSSTIYDEREGNRASGDIDQFNPALGTLTGITISGHFGFQLLVDTLGFNDDDSEPALKLTYSQVTNVLFGAGPATIAFQLTNPLPTIPIDNGPLVNVALLERDVAFAVADSLFSNFIGTGTIEAFGSSRTQFSGTLSGADYIPYDVVPSDAGTFVDMTIAYSYTPSAAAAVPEPAAWAMMIGGFGMIGAALRRRRAPTVRFA